MKHLKVEYTTDGGNSIVLYDAEVNEVVWTDGPNGIRVEGKTGTGGGGMGGLLDLLTGASKARTEAVVEEKRASLAGPAADAQVVDADPTEATQG